MRARLSVVISPAPWVLIAIGLAVAASAGEKTLPRELEAIGNSFTAIRPLPPPLVDTLNGWVEPAEPVKSSDRFISLAREGSARISSPRQRDTSCSTVVCHPPPETSKPRSVNSASSPRTFRFC